MFITIDTHHPFIKLTKSSSLTETSDHSQTTLLHSSMSQQHERGIHQEWMNIHGQTQQEHDPEHLPSSHTYSRTSQMLVNLQILNTLVNQLVKSQTLWKHVLDWIRTGTGKNATYENCCCTLEGKKKKKPKPRPLVEGNAPTGQKAPSAKRPMHLYSQYHSQSRQAWGLA